MHLLSEWYCFDIKSHYWGKEEHQYNKSFHSDGVLCFILLLWFILTQAFWIFPVCVCLRCERQCDLVSCVLARLHMGVPSSLLVILTYWPEINNSTKPGSSDGPHEPIDPKWQVLRADSSHTHSCDSQRACWRLTHWLQSRSSREEQKLPEQLWLASDINANISLMASFICYNIWAVKTSVAVSLHSPIRQWDGFRLCQRSDKLLSAFPLENDKETLWSPALWLFYSWHRSCWADDEVTIFSFFSPTRSRKCFGQSIIILR